MRIATVIGVMCASGGFLYGIYTIVKRLLLPDIQAGFSALMSMLVFMGGMIMLMLGVLGEYIWRTLDAARTRPPYIVDEVNEVRKNSKG